MYHDLRDLPGSGRTTVELRLESSIHRLMRVGKAVVALHTARHPRAFEQPFVPSAAGAAISGAPALWAQAVIFNLFVASATLDRRSLLAGAQVREIPPRESKPYFPHLTLSHEVRLLMMPRSCD